MMTLEDALDKTKTLGILSGRYDATHGNKNFMLGIASCLEVLADMVDESYCDELVNNFYANMEESERKAGKRK